MLYSFYSQRETSNLFINSKNNFNVPKRKSMKKISYKCSYEMSTRTPSFEVISHSNSIESLDNGFLNNLSVPDVYLTGEDITTTDKDLMILEMIEVTDSHYSMILPIDKKSNIMNQVFSEFEKKHFAKKSYIEYNDSSESLYEEFIRNLKAILTIINKNWEKIRHQQGDSLAASCLVIVCDNVGISLRSLMRDLKHLNKY